MNKDNIGKYIYIYRFYEYLMTIPQSQDGTVLPRGQILLRLQEFQRHLYTFNIKSWKLWVQIRETRSHDRVRFIHTWVQPAQRPPRSHDVSSTSDKVSSVSNDEAVLRHQLIHGVEHLQGIQVTIRLLISLSPGGQRSVKHCERIHTVFTPTLLTDWWLK